MTQSQTTELIYDLDDVLLYSETNSRIANFITHEACQKYFNEYKSPWIPLSFIEFYFEEYKRYAFMSPEFLEPFFNLYTTKDLDAIIENYYNARYSLITKKSTKKHETYYYITKNEYFSVNLYERSFLGFLHEALYKNIEIISNHFKNRDELLTLKETYEYYMIKKTILSYDSSNKSEFYKLFNSKKSIKAEAKEPVKPQEQTKSSVLVGNSTELPQQKGKVFKLFFPKLNLPSPYPSSQDKSRINSNYRIKKLLNPDKQVTIINHHKFNGVKYSIDFIEKRKAAQKPARRKFDFDF